MFEVEYTELLKLSSSSTARFLSTWHHDIECITFPLTVVSQQMSSLYPHLFLLSPRESTVRALCEHWESTVGALWEHCESTVRAL